MGTISSRNSPSEQEPARFALWPLPDLRVRSETSSTPTHLQAMEESNDPRSYQEGFQDGQAAERAHRQAEIERMMAMIDAVHGELVEAKARFVAESHSTLHTLAVAIARQVIQREVECDEEIVAELVRRALHEVDAEQAVEVRINPADLDVCLREIGNSSDGETRRVEWKSDPSIDRGSCIVASTDRIVDGRIDATHTEILHRLNHG